MAINGYAEEKAALAGILAAAWTETVIAWPSKDFETPDADTASWLEFNIVNGEATQISVGVPGANVMRHPGLVSIMVYSPPVLGETEALRLADLAAKLYRNNNSISGVRFNPPSINRLGIIRNYTQVNVTIPFNRDSLL